MDHHKLRSLVWQLGYIGILNTVGVLTSATTIFAQNVITPDDILGTESSDVQLFTPEIGLITGGATSGQNLFHSFEEFSVGEGN